MSKSKNKPSILGKQPRVIVAAPDADWAKELADSLHRAGYVPHRAPSAETTTLAVNYRNPAAVFLDAAFLETVGFNLLDNVKRLGPSAPVIVVTDAEDPDMRARCLALGAEDCITRPFAANEAVLRLRRSLDRRHAMATMTHEKLDAESRVEGMASDLAALRHQLRKNVDLIQRAVDFHQRLDPGADSAELQTEFVRNLSHQLGVDRLAYLAMPRTGSSWLTAVTAWGVPSRLLEGMRVHAEGELAKLMEATAGPVRVQRLQSLPRLRLELGILSAGGFTAALPLLNAGRLMGLVLLGERRGGGTPDEDTLRMGQLLASALTPALATQARWARERHLSAETLGLLVEHLERGNPYLNGHSVRVAELAESLGVRAGLGAEALSSLTTAALLHDVGRFEVDAALWNKTDELTGDDWELIQKHPGESARLLAEAAWPSEILSAVRHHHERWDGTGYPDRLSREEIPFSARILAVADALEALTRERPHRPAMSLPQALDVLQSEAGTKYDPLLIALLGEEKAGVGV